MIYQIESFNFEKESEIGDIMKQMAETLEGILLRIDEKERRTNDIKNKCESKYASISSTLEGIYYKESFTVFKYDISIDVFCNNKCRLIECYSEGYGSLSEKIECYNLLNYNGRFNVSVPLKEIPHILTSLFSKLNLKEPKKMLKIDINANIYSYNTISETSSVEVKPYDNGVFIKYYEDNLRIVARIEYENTLRSQ